MIRNESLQGKSKARTERRAARMNPASIGLGVFATALVGSVVAGVDLPLISSDRVALYALAALGFTMCAIGPLGDMAARGRWLSWAGILGVLLGVVAMGIVVAIVAGIDLPLIAGDRAAFTALAGIVAVKLGAGVMYRLAG
jgi:hypothetical protein